jgi:hypothetical protein
VILWVWRCGIDGAGEINSFLVPFWGRSVELRSTGHPRTAVPR